MEEPSDLRWLGSALGLGLMALFLLDVFLTVLYARARMGPVSHHVTRLTGWVFRGFSRPFGRHRGIVLTACGPAVLLLIIAVWALGLTLGSALIIQPHLGTAIRSSSGEATPTDFVTAMYAGGSSMSLVGASDFTPHTTRARLFYLFTSLVGASVLSLTLSYLVQVYAALQRRNALALKLHLATGETGDAARLVAAVGPRGVFSAGYTNLATLSAELADVKEAHHFYPLLFYFRFRDPLYAVSRFTLVALDAATLIKSGLDDGEQGWLKESSSVNGLWRSSMLLVTTLEATFLPGGVPDAQEPPDEPTRDRWRRRYAAAVERLRQSGIQTATDEQAGAATYVSLRAQWDRRIAALAPSMAYGPDEVDPAG